jgi:peptidoglycan/xylan/chitin deacetylase (PgdA/CDA1 family)
VVVGCKIMITQIPVLAYHKIDWGNKSLGWITINRFRSHLDTIKSYNYTTISLNDLYLYKTKSESIPDNPIIITFDDGYENFYSIVYPILKKYNFTATNFLPTDFISNDKEDRHSNREWESKTNNEYNFEAKHLIWDEIKEMNDNNFEFGSHTKSHHPNLRSLSDKLLEEEIIESKDIIEDKIKNHVYFFSYPYGKYKSSIEKILLENGYRGSVIGGNCKYNINEDNMVINRFLITMRTNLDEILHI